MVLLKIFLYWAFLKSLLGSFFAFFPPNSGYTEGFLLSFFFVLFFAEVFKKKHVLTVVFKVLF